MSSNLIAAHGGSLVDLIVNQERAEELKAQSRDWPSWDLTARQLCDLELLMNGGFSPLTGFMPKEAYGRVCQEMRLPDGTLWPLPITLDVSEAVANKLDYGSSLVLRDFEGVMLAVLHVEDVWRADLVEEGKKVYGSANPEHPGVVYLLKNANPWYVGGGVEGIRLPAHYDFVELRLTPAQLRQRFAALGWRCVVAFQTRNPMHRAHQELTLRAARELQANVLIHPVVGMTKPGDVDHYTRVRCYQVLLRHYPHNTAMLSLLPLGGRDCMASLLDKGVPELGSPLLGKVLETMSFYKEKLSGYPKCTKAVHVTQPDLQGVMDNLHLIWGIDMFIYLHKEPQLIHGLMDLMADTYIAMVKKLTPYTSQQAEEDCIYLHWGVCRGSLLMKNDIPAMISPQMYEEFVRPYDEKVLAAFPGGRSIHIGGGGDHGIEGLSNTRGLGSVHLDPQSNMDLWHKALGQHGVSLVDIVCPKQVFFSGEYKERFPTGISFVTEVDGLDGGRRLKAFLDGT